MIQKLTMKGGKIFFGGDGVPVGSEFDGEGSGFDDLELKDVTIFKDDSLLMKIPIQPNASGYYPASSMFNFPFETKGMQIKTAHEVGLKLSDTSNNEADGFGLAYTTVGAHCVNDVQDEDEEDVDCGGASCLACDTNACTDDSQCQSGACNDAGICVDSPVIQGVFLNNGAKGNYVTLVGKGFGNTKVAGDEVLFAGGSDKGIADIVSCPLDGTLRWTDTEIVMEIPDLALGDDYVVRVSRAGGTFDTTKTAPGPLLPDFEINEIVRPSIACVHPVDDITFGSPLDVYGKNFGNPQGANSTISVGPIAVAPSKWSNSRVSIAVPSVSVGKQSVVLERAGQSSNPVNIDVIGLDEYNTPVVGSVFPADGKRGDMITIIGNGFGLNNGTVFFGDGLTLADTDLPQQCSEAAAWTDTKIIVKIPTDIAFGDQDVRVERIGPVAQSAPYPYVVFEGEPSPNLCSASPASGPVGTSLSLAGELFGNDVGSIEVGDAGVSSIGSWADSEIQSAVVPSGSASGNIIVSDTEGLESNPIPFIINDCQVDGCVVSGNICCTVGTAIGACVEPTETCPGLSGEVTAAYEWIFSTGKIPVIPALVNQCGVGLLPSPAPTNVRNGGDDVCINAAVTGVFNIQVKDVVYEKDIIIQKCTSEGDDVCETVEAEAVAASLSMEDSDTSFAIGPTEDLFASSTYRVTLSNSIVSVPEEGDPIHMAKDVSCASVPGLVGEPSDCFTFTTSPLDEKCSVESVLVNPGFHQVSDIGPLLQGAPPEGNTDLFEWTSHGIGADVCVALDTAGEAWGWSTEGDFSGSAAVNPLGGTKSHKSGGTAHEALPPSELVQIQAEYTNPDDTKVSSQADLSITQEAPYVIGQGPECSLACINGQIHVEFNTLMRTSVMAGNTKVYPCFDESCKTVKASVSSGTQYQDLQQIQTSKGLISVASDVLMMTNPSDLLPSTWYKAVIQGGDSGVKSAFGLPLTQTNDGDNFSWKFRTRDSDDPCVVTQVDMVPVSATVKAQGQTASYMAVPRTEADACDPNGQKLNGWSYDWNWTVDDADVGLLVDDGVDSGVTQPWCNAAGQLSGSNPVPAVCGDGNAINDFEDCDDGNLEDGDGCSSHCLNEGISTTTNEDGEVFSDELCGNANPAASVAEYVSSINNIWIDAGEECDDGNLIDNDGCSSQCLNEGSGAGGVVCGNGDIGPGEDCDDGNTSPGDGCSGICLYEGSPQLNLACSTVTSFSTSADIASCSGNVLFAACGNGVNEAGEACDDGNVLDGDGCSSNCLFENPTAQQNVCTPVSTSDGKIDPVQTVISVGAGVVNAQMLQLTGVHAQPAGSSVVGDADFALQCGYQPLENCAAAIGESDSEYGVSTNSCCLARPDIDYAYPEGVNVCLNTAIFVDVNKKIDIDSLEGNVALYDSHCTPGETPFIVADVLGSETSTWYAHAWGSMKRMALSFVYDVAYAITLVDLPPELDGEFCEADVSGLVATVDIADQITELPDGTTATIPGGTRVYFNLTELLDPEEAYMMVLAGGENGVRSTDGVPMYQGSHSIGTWFTTTQSEEPCVIDSVTINPKTTTLSTFDNVNEHFVAEATTKDGADLVQIPDVYAWDWSWQLLDQDPDNVLNFASAYQNVESAVDIQRIVGHNDINGSGVVAAGVEITADIVTGTQGQTFDDTAEVEVYLCENAWPPPSEHQWGGVTDFLHGFADASYYPEFKEMNDFMLKSAFGQSFDLGPLRTNFAFKYCRDQGAAQDTSDDLPALIPLVISNPPNSQTTLKEFFFSPDVFGNKDVIGIRVEKNLDHLPLLEWYESRGFQGNPTPTTIDGFPALQDGRTVYVSGVNATTPVNGLFITDARTNVYVIGYNQGAQPVTLTIFQQIIENFELMVNSFSSGGRCFNDHNTTGLVGQRDYNTEEPYVKNNSEWVSCESVVDCSAFSPVDGDHTIRCSNVKSALVRDLVRLSDLRTITNELEVYYLDQNSYPTLSSGSFIPGRSVSTWGSWQSNLGNNLGTALPLDPLNSHTACDDPNAEQSTCWNSLEQTYSCPAGSHVYEYQMTAGGQSYQLRTDFELPSSLWTDYDIDNPQWVTSNACTGQSLGAAAVPVCGNGLIEAGEQCDPSGITKTEDLFNVPGEIETLTSICSSSCQWQPQGSASYSACGNGIIDEEYDEVCDDGLKNGTYGFCDSGCNGVVACGDGVIQDFASGGPEVCEFPVRCSGDESFLCSLNAGDGCTQNRTDTELLYSDWELYSGCTYSFEYKSGVGTHSFDCGSCQTVSGTSWALKQADSCNWDCREFGLYCGDNIVNGNEECDAGVGGGVVSESCVLPSGVGGQKSVECTSECMWEREETVGICPTCPVISFPLTIEGAACEEGAPGAGPQEEVFDGCGDGNSDEGEECDLGAQNALSCNAPYGNPANICTFCHVDTCALEAASGPFCGDEVLNGDEECDAAAIKGGASTACVNLGYEYGTPTCNNVCTGYTEEGCQYCSYSESPIAGGTRVRGLFRNPAALNSAEAKFTDADELEIKYEGEFISGGVKTVDGAVEVYLSYGETDSGAPACSLYDLEVWEVGLPYLVDTIPNFVSDGQNYDFRRLYPTHQHAEYTTLLFVVEWDKPLKNVDVAMKIYGIPENMDEVSKHTPLVDASDSFKDGYKNDPQRCFGINGDPGSLDAPLSCAEADGLYASLLYDNDGSEFGFESFAVVRPQADSDSIVLGSASDYTFTVIDADEKGIMQEEAANLILHVYNEDGDEVQTVYGAKSPSANMAHFQLFSNDGVVFTPVGHN